MSRFSDDGPTALPAFHTASWGACPENQPYVDHLLEIVKVGLQIIEHYLVHVRHVHHAGIRRFLSALTGPLLTEHGEGQRGGGPMSRLVFLMCLASLVSLVTSAVVVHFSAFQNIASHVQERFIENAIVATPNPDHAMRRSVERFDELLNSTDNTVLSNPRTENKEMNPLYYDSFARLLFNTLRNAEGRCTQNVFINLLTGQTLPIQDKEGNVVNKSLVEALNDEYAYAYERNRDLYKKNKLNDNKYPFGSGMILDTRQSANRIPVYFEGNVSSDGKIYTEYDAVRGTVGAYRFHHAWENVSEEEDQRDLAEIMAKVSGFPSVMDRSLLKREQAIVMFQASVRDATFGHGVVGLVRETEQGIKFGVMDTNFVPYVIHMAFMEKVESFLSGFETENEKKQHAHRFHDWQKSQQDAKIKAKNWLFLQPGFFTEEELTMHGLNRFVSIANNPIREVAKVHTTKSQYDNYVQKHSKTLTFQFRVESTKLSVSFPEMQYRLPFLKLTSTDMRQILKTVKSFVDAFDLFKQIFRENNPRQFLDRTGGGGRRKHKTLVTNRRRHRLRGHSRRRRHTQRRTRNLKHL